MTPRRRAFRPEVVGTLEDRLVLSAVAPATLAAFEHGPQLHPVVVETVQGSDRVKTLTRGGEPLHGQLTFSTQDVALNAPDAGGPAVGTFKVDYHNESSKAITSATIVETLAPGLAYVPDGSFVPAGGQVSVTSNAKGEQVLRLGLPDGIAPGVEGEFFIEAEAVAPTTR